MTVLPSPAAPVRFDGLVHPVQVQGNPGVPAGDAGSETRPPAPGADHAAGAFGYFGMAVSILIVLFAVALLIRKTQRSK
ncbi:hypothetical protein [Microvirga pudoricolor]|uniref:hypothetical protein n=1 Tax=Microvirga pudoricolor TaxID=2778729 RepID=UPI00194DB2FD|nr:hypothetical protein [Microvirga pudoricolor]MBM6594061.1 hypothetical protein [Microvirga pudoricolor]